MSNFLKLHTTLKLDAEDVPEGGSAHKMSARFWCFTLNNHSVQEEQHIADQGRDNDAILYLVAGREVGESGTPHLQGFVAFATRHNLTQVKSILGARIHLEIARSSPKVASDYCKKDGDFMEYGTCPVGQGRRGDWDAYTDWVVDLGRVPTDLEVARDFPSLYARYSGACRTIAQAALPSPRLVPAGSTLRPWQQDLCNALDLPADDRTVSFFVDEEGNKGKSWLCRYLLQEKPSEVQLLGIGRVVDVAYLLDPEKRIFLIDCERSASQFLQYRVLEQIKNRLVTSTKYLAQMKILRHSAHVVVFMNEIPDMNALSVDRYDITRL